MPVGNPWNRQAPFRSGVASSLSQACDSLRLGVSGILWSLYCTSSRVDWIICSYKANSFLSVSFIILIFLRVIYHFFNAAIPLFHTIPSQGEVVPQNNAQKKDGRIRRHLSRSCSLQKKNSSMIFTPPIWSVLTNICMRVYVPVAQIRVNPSYCCCTPSEPIIADSYAVSRRTPFSNLNSYVNDSFTGLARTSIGSQVGWFLQLQFPVCNKGVLLYIQFRG